ncbi:MAG: hypothetical protein JF593_00235 [Novosphingobium sp.]|nr:hypothetical protein [Novosphingobium sp.]
MNGETTLPSGFAALEPFVSTWAVATTAERAALRGSSTAEQREAFFAAASPLLETALDHLDKSDVRHLAPADQRLMQLMLALAHISHAVEIQGPDEAAHTPWRARMRIIRSPADA